MYGLSSLISRQFFKLHNILLVPILTGSALLEHSNLYGMRAPVLIASRFSQANQREITFTAARLPKNGVNNRLWYQLMDTCGGIALWHRNLGSLLLGKSHLTDLNDARSVWEQLCKYTQLQYPVRNITKLVNVAIVRYPRSIWSHYFGDVQNVRKLLGLSVLQQAVTFNTKINGETLGSHLQSGVLFPYKHNDNGEFYLDFPLVTPLGCQDVQHYLHERTCAFPPSKRAWIRALHY